MKYFIVAILAFMIYPLWATHNRAGEITYQQIGPLTIRMTVTTYTKESSITADRDSLEIFWGDGLSEWVKRSNGKGQSLENDVKLNRYTADHTYPGRSSYTISFIDPNRSGNILNINYPRSEDIRFYLSTRFTLLDLQFQGSNNSAQLLQPPIDIACLGQPFIHNPNAYDPDGDSLSYELITPLENENVDVPSYLFPDQVIPGPTNQIFLDTKTGDFIWRNPPQQGEYNIAMRINEWREGVLINSIVRDMQILVKDCQSRPPVINVQKEWCVLAGTVLNIPIQVSDPDINQRVRLSVTGGPLTLENNAATLLAPVDFVKVPFDGVINWKTNCNHIVKEYYQIVIRAVDNSIGDTSGLATLTTIKIKVVGPPPSNPAAVSENGQSIKLSWQSPYACENTDDDYFYGFSVWRKNQSIELPVDTCNLNSLKNYYTRIVFNTKQQADGRYFIIDKEVQDNTTYCYRIQAEFAKKTVSGNPYKKVESIYSDEVCIQLKRDIPLITKVSVETTDVTNGSIAVKWAKPLLVDFDTLKFSGPYKTELYEKVVGAANYTLIGSATKISTTFQGWRDTSYTHTSINTQANSHQYLLKFYYNNNIEYKPIPEASSVFISIEAADKKNILSFMYSTPWANKLFEIQRKNDQGIFETIGQSTSPIFTDQPLINGVNYCYKVKALGTYAISKIENPLINFSQESCSHPTDNEAPCPPITAVTSICDLNNISAENAENEISWKPFPDCINDEKITSYNVYYQKDSLSTPILIYQHNGIGALKFFHLPDSNDISGCYTVTAVDSIGNESVKSNIICIENCPVYELPNTFTPNTDGSNDFFKPLKNFFIASVDFKVYNEWGNRVFSTNAPPLNWNGHDNSNRPLAEGTYYYTCATFVKQGGTVVKDKILKGYINILR